MAVERLDPRVLEVVRAATDRYSTYAAIWRRVRPQLERHALAVPSYDTIRLLAREERARRAGREPGSAGIELDLVSGRVRIRDWS
jgi:hypothetical protein